MFCRAKISVLLPLVGALTASGALLNPEQQNTAFQPSGDARFARPSVWRPAGATRPIKFWAGANGQKITPNTQTLARVEMKGITFTKTRDAVITPGRVAKAGGNP